MLLLQNYQKVIEVWETLRSMADVIDLTVDWDRGTIKKALAELPEKMEKAAFEALDEGADFMVVMAKTLVRVDTGTLQKSIRKERGGIGKSWRVVRVRAGGYFVNPKTGRLCDYAHWVEMHYPYMRPAFEHVRSYIKDLIRDGVVAEIKQ
jgi:hypothetical protein